MSPTERQNLILENIVKDYIDLAYPISSEFLEKKHHFGLSPATIRIELQKLTDRGYLYQPHTSAGRVPTDKGYRFFVDNLFARQSFASQNLGGEDFKIGDWFAEIGDTIKFIQSLTKNLAATSHALALSYFEKEKLFWKDGWEEVLKEPEFRDEYFIINFAELLDSFEKNIEDFEINSGIKIYIGRENPFKKAKDFSIISSRCHLPHEGEGIISLLGPKRMDYDRNISLINSLTKLLAEF